MVTLGRRGRYGLAVGAVVLLAAVIAIVAALLRQPPPPKPAPVLDTPATRPESPAVSARYAAWSDRAARGATGILLYDAATGETKRITSPRFESSQPAIASGTVVYVDHRNAEGDLYRYDITSGKTRPFVVAPGRQSAPSADGDWVVWEDDRTSYGPRVRARRLSDGAEMVLPTAQAGGVQRRPKVANGFVVWEEYGAGALGAANARIYGYDLAARRIETISASDTVQLLPATDGRYVVWSLQRGGRLGLAVWDRGTRALAEPPGQVGERTTPAVGGGVVYWIERCNRAHFEVCTWRPGDATTTPLPGPGSVNQVGIQAAQGSRMWFEYRIQRWHVRADLAVKEPSAAKNAEVSAAFPLPLDEHGATALDRAPARLTLVQDTAAPSPPAAPVASAAGTGSVVVDWQPSTDNVGVAGYDVYRYSSPLGPNTLALASKVASVASPPVTVPVAANEAAVHYTLYYAILARDAAGNTALSANTVPDPHGTSVAGANVETCQRCHLSPTATAPNPALRQACYGCHGDTPATTAYGQHAPFDVQAEFLDDTATVVPAGASKHRNSFMTDTARECDGCHTPHRKPYDPDPAASYTMLLRTQIATATSGQSGYRYSTKAAPVGNRFCFDCHGTGLTPISLVGGSTAYINAGGDHETGWATSAHGTKVATPTTDPAVQCEACHDNHGSRAGALLGKYDQATQTYRIAGAVVTGDDNSVCLACHNAASAGWPVYSKDASGFPVRGAWPGATVYNTTYDPANQTGSMHNTATVVWPGTSYAGGDCKNCHRMHGPADRYDILRDTDPNGNPGAEPFDSRYFSFCFDCHDGTPGFDIRRYYPSAAGGTGTGTRAGHVTRTDGTLPAGSALPCYDCHNPHGSASAYGLAIVTQTSAATTIAVGDTAGELSMGPGRAAADVRRFCLSCHTTADNANGWNGSAFVGITSGARVEGIDRVSTLSRLRLPSVTGHNSSDSQACYDCHGNDYGSASGANVHSPGGGVSTGGVACYTCHSGYRSPMDLTGATRTSWYHHVLGTAAIGGDLAPFTGAFPATVSAAAQEVYCVSCHTDHNYFNGNRGANLRLGIGLAGSQTTNTDFVPTAPYGICVSCHSTSFTRDNANQKAGGGPSTLVIGGADFGASTHSYTAASSFSGSAFRGNCSKCHSDGRPASYQGTSTAFSLHYSLDSRLNQAMTLSVPTTWTSTGSSACYKCHSTSTADNPNTGASKDWYGIAVMSANSMRMHQAVQQTYAHPVDGNPNAHSSNEVTTGATWPWSNRHVTCEDCHNVHASKPGVHTAGSSVAGPAVNGAVGVKPSWTATGNFTTPTAYAAVTLKGGATDWEAYLCLKCHSSYGGTPSGTSPSGAPRTNLAVEFNPGNQSYHRVLGTDMSAVRNSFLVNGTTYSWPTPTTFFKSPWNVSYMLTCTDCHTGNPAYARGPHGSSVQFMIDPAYPVLWGTTNARLQQSSPGMNPQLICAKCHVLFNGSTWGNVVHSKGDHQSIPCTRCHAGIPHGWKRPRLLSYTTDPVPYGHTSGLVQLRLRSYPLSGGEQGGWQEGDCATNCGQHGSSVSPAWP